MGALTDHVPERSWAHRLGRVRKIAPGLMWQSGAFAVPVARGDIVVVSGAPRCLSNLALLLRARFGGARTIWWGHYWGATSQPWRFFLRLLLMRSADAILFYTDAEVDDYRRLKPGDKRPVAALNNGIDTAPGRAGRTQYCAAERERAFLLIGRLTAKAQTDLALQALAKPEAAGIVLHVLGGGDAFDDLKDQAARLGVQGRVHWHGGTADERRIAAIANRCRAFVYPGEVGLSIIHAMAYGLPALVHDDRRRHMPEIAAFTAGETGLTFRRHDANDLAQIMGRMIDDGPSLERWSASAIAVTEQSFNTEDMAARFMALVAKIP